MTHSAPRFLLAALCALLSSPLIAQPITPAEQGRSTRW
jgi:hypothetical protein